MDKPTDSEIQLDVEAQSFVDSLVQVNSAKASYQFKPFNPNFISDYKGYQLGMSTSQIDALLLYRSSGKYVNTAEEFQKVTGVSDSVLQLMEPYFKFPDWVAKGKKPQSQRIGVIKADKEKRLKQIDINSATAADFQMISGIGEKLSARIVKFRDRLGGFLTEEQLVDVYGLDHQIAKKAMQVFVVKNQPNIIKININQATAEELKNLVYINWNLANAIVAHRELNGAFTSMQDLDKVAGFPTEKLHRIALYLSI
ncbi:ComEA family DNA-binding protein [Croceivirga radicis]|uniref:ComEA family DNA-binding protein n=1 Tax=Croceivirga radicis TaxID=1929488 RepID=UPI0002EB9865|nr:helix-hairpin-helix domain-containing protein [Croceivirga radicis]